MRLITKNEIANVITPHIKHTINQLLDSVALKEYKAKFIKIIKGQKNNEIIVLVKSENEDGTMPTSGASFNDDVMCYYLDCFDIKTIKMNVKQFKDGDYTICPTKKSVKNFLNIR